MLYDQNKVEQKGSFDYNHFKIHSSSSSSSMKSMSPSESNGRLPQLESRKSSKIRCFQCKKRLTISSNYKCRFVL